MEPHPDGVSANIPITAVGDGQAAAPPLDGSSTDIDTAPAVMVGRSRWKQYKALMQKHVSSYTRQSEVLFGEIVTTFIYLVLLICFGLTSSIESQDTNANQWAANVTVATSTDALATMPFAGEFVKYCPSGPCYLAFGDEESGDGCSAALRGIIGAMALCAFGSDPMLAANRSAFQQATGSNAISCKCTPPNRLRDFEYLKQERIGGAVEFTNLSDTFFNYTLHLIEPQVDANTPLFESPLNRNREASTTAVAVDGFTRSSLLLQIALDSAILQGKSIAVGIAKFPTVGSGFFQPGALGNVPFYVTFLMFISLQGLAAGVAEEGTKGLSHSLFMVGLSPVVYWAAWFTVLGLKQLIVSLVCLLILSFACSIPNLEVAALLVPIALVALWSIQFAVFLGLFNLKPKTASTLLLAVPSIFSIIPTVLAFNPAATGLPGTVHLVLAFIMPSYAFSVTMMQVLLLSSPEYGGFTFANYGVESDMGIKTSHMIIAQLVGCLVMALLITWRFWSTFGIASSKKKSGGGGRIDSAGPTPAVSVRGLKKGWGSFQAVDGLTVDFFSGQITAFLGHNGAGKSTTIKLLTGLYSSDGGDALVDGKSIVTEMDQVREVIGVCPQDNILWDFLTVREHMEFIANIVGVSAESREQHITGLLTQVGLAGKSGDISKSLSGGMKRKLMLAMALTGDPKVLFLDEPTAGMDAGARREVWSLLLRKRHGRSIILCTHYMDEADILGDRIAVIHAGRLQDAGTSSDLKIKYGKHVRLQLTLSAGADRRSLMETVEGAVGSAAGSGGKRVTLDTSDLMEDEELIRQVTKETLDSREEGDLNLLLPLDTDIAAVLQRLEESKKGGHSHLEDFTVVAPTLTDVFWELEQLAAAEEEREQSESPAVGNGRAGGATVTLAELAKVPAPGASFSSKMWIMLGRQSTTWVRDAADNLPGGSGFPLPARELFYMALLTISLLLTMINFTPSRPASAVVDLDPAAAFSGLPARMGLFYYREGTGLGGTAAAQATSTADTVLPWLSNWATSPGSTVPVPVDGAELAPCPLAAVINIEDACVCSNSCADKDELPKGSLGGQDATPYGYVAVLEFDRNANHTILSVSPEKIPAPNVSLFDIYYVIRPNRSTLASVPGVVSLVDGAAFAEWSHDSAARPTIATSFATLASEDNSEDSRAEETAQLELLMAQLKSILLIMVLMPLNNIMSDVARKVVLEKQQNIKQLQILMGVLPLEYFLAKISWDLLWAFGVFFVPVVVAVSLPACPLSSPATVLLFLAFPAAMIPMIYTIVRGWDDAEYSTSRISGIIWVATILTYMPYFVLAIPFIVDGISVSSGQLQVIRVCLALWPPTGLLLGLRAVILSDAYGYDPLSPSVSASDLQVEDQISKYLFGEAMPIETAFAPLVLLVLEAIVLAALPVLAERRGGLCSCCGDVCFQIKDALCRCVCLDCCWGDSNQANKEEIRLDASDVEDADVKEERRVIDASCSAARCSSDEAALVNSMEQGTTPDEATPAVLLNHVNKTYRPSGTQRFEGTTAVHDLCLRIRRRECFSLLGTNGAGKTTTLSMIMRQFEPTGGDIKINGKSIYGLSGDADEAFKSFGFCPQHNALFDTHTTREMLTFYARIRGVSTEQLEAYIDSWLVGCRLMPHANTACGKLSGGNKRKLSLAIAILGSPDLTVLDEPSAGVDPAARKQLHRIINAVKSQGTTVILTTHHMSEAAKLGDRVGIMVQGHLACLGSPGHLLNAYSEGYGVTVCMVAGKSVHDKVLPMLHASCPSIKVTNLPSAEYVAANLGSSESFSVVELYRALEDMRRAGEVAFFSCGKSNLESVFLKFAKMANVDTLLGDDGEAGEGETGGVAPDGARRHSAEGDERGDEEWGAELYMNSASKVVLEMTDENPFSCLFGRCKGFGRKFGDNEWLAQVPSRLERRGVTAQEWAEMMGGLRTASELGSTCDPMRGAHCCIISVGALTFSWGWLCMCCPWSECDPFQTAMREWLEDCNSKLEPKGIFVKGFTFGKRKAGGLSSSNSKHGLSVLVFALSRMEIKRVQDEPVLQTPPDDSKYACWHCTAHKGRAI